MRPCSETCEETHGKRILTRGGEVREHNRGLRAAVLGLGDQADLGALLSGLGVDKQLGL